MLEHFDAIPEPQGSPISLFEMVRAAKTHNRPPPLDSDPAGGRLFNPDIIQHALHMYLYRRMRALEGRELLPLLRETLDALLDAALHDTEAPTETRARTLAWLLVPAVLLRAGAADATDVYEHRRADDDPDACPEIPAPWRGRLGPALADMAAAELSRIHTADETAPCPLPGLATPFPAGRGGELDYTAFRPRGYYVATPALRAWFRAMIWFSHLGLALDDERGLACALDFAALLERTPAFAPSRDNEEDEEDEDADGEPRRPPQSRVLTPREALARIMRLTALFHGSPDAATLEDWLSLLDKTRPRTPAAVRRALPDLLPSIRDFACLREENRPTRVLTLFPARFSVPWRVADALTAKDVNGLRELPERFSGLWLPAVFGDARARACLEGQIAECLRVGRDVDARGAPRSGKSGEGPTPALVRKAEAALRREMERLKQRLDVVPPADWTSSLAALRMRLLATQTAAFGPGFPLYMQDPLFGAKQLETFMGTYTELRHDTLLYEKPAPMGDRGLPCSWRDVLPVPTARCLVEPNLPFWRALRGLLAEVEAAFREAGVFAEDLGKDGDLRRLRECADLCAAVALKALRGEEPDAGEHWALYHMKLDRLAAPRDESGWGKRLESEWRAGLVADVQSKPAGPWSGATYEALAVPYFMFVLTGTGDSRRIVSGLAYNHREFVGPFGRRLDDRAWQARAYSGTQAVLDQEEGRPLPKARPLPNKNFWYEGPVP